jgi:hypothetical protein
MCSDNNISDFGSGLIHTDNFELYINKIPDTFFMCIAQFYQYRKSHYLYFMLATLMPDDAAMNLSEELIQLTSRYISIFLPPVRNL